MNDAGGPPGGAGALPGRPYVGRFAPSPTGSLHLGSLVAAVGSFLDARRNGGRWLVRMEDLDAARVIPGADSEILRTLEGFGLQWDGVVEYQSRRTGRYRDALESLKSQELTFECSCSRRELTNTGDTGYRGTCHAGPTRPGATATRFRIDPRASVDFADLVQGCCKYELRPLGDFVIKRRDGTFAYQLAVVIDDAQQEVTHVIRGVDLLASTPWQIALSGALGLPMVRYGHLPLVVEREREKLSKSRQSLRVDSRFAAPQLAVALRLLQHPPPQELRVATPRELLAWAVNAWHADSLRGVRQVSVPPADHY